MSGHPSEEGAVIADGPNILKDNLAESRTLAQLLLSAILIDTANLTQKVTPHDIQASHFLASLLPELQFGEFYNEMRHAKLSIKDMSFTDLLRRDYKEYKTKLGKLGMSTIIRSIPDLKSAYTSIENEIRSYIAQQNLATHVIMTVSGEGETFRRGGMVITQHGHIIERLREEGGAKYQIKAVDAGDGFFQDAEGGWLCWEFEQGDLRASRKQIAPLVMEIMGNDGEMEERKNWKSELGKFRKMIGK